MNNAMDYEEIVDTTREVDALSADSEQDIKEKPKEEDIEALGSLFDVPLKVSVELGRGDITLRELLLIGESTVIELGKLAGEPLEVLVNNRLVSKGEVVVVNDKYGIRLTDIIDPVANGNDAIQA